MDESDVTLSYSFKEGKAEGKQAAVAAESRALEFIFKKTCIISLSGHTKWRQCVWPRCLVITFEGTAVQDKQ